jgi:hypothetical protein
MRARVRHPAGFVWMNKRAATWANVRRGRLVIVRNRAVIWQSAARYAVQDAASQWVMLRRRAGKLPHVTVYFAMAMAFSLMMMMMMMEIAAGLVGAQSRLGALARGLREVLDGSSRHRHGDGPGPGF